MYGVEYGERASRERRAGDLVVGPGNRVEDIPHDDEDIKKKKRWIQHTQQTATQQCYNPIRYAPPILQQHAERPLLVSAVCCRSLPPETHTRQESSLGWAILLEWRSFVFRKVYSGVCWRRTTAAAAARLSPVGIILDQIGCEPFNRVWRTLLDEGTHAVQEDGHHCGIEIGPDR